MSLEEIRKKIVEKDKEIIDTIKQRMDLIDEVIEIKKKTKQQIQDQDREKELKQEINTYATEKGIDTEYAKEIHEKLLEMSREKQKNKMGEGNLL